MNTITRYILPDEKGMGLASSRDVGRVLAHYTSTLKVPIVLSSAAAPSMNAYLEALTKREGIDWNLVYAIHLDEYNDLPDGHPNTFKEYLKDHIFDQVPIPAQNIYYIKDVPGTPAQVAWRYEQKIKALIRWVRSKGGIYFSVIGIGVNGHIAFNEPNVDKRTSRMVIQVHLDQVSLKQQYDDYKDHRNPMARYASVDDVPREAITISCAGILASDKIICIVPGAHKAHAVQAMWDGPITEDLPASMLRLHNDVSIYLDRASSALLQTEPLLRC
ncbi:MAG: hypothetical protein A2445_04275 [Candidatus Jacksonbacteria bacterium RIFOXYC2_FULL_44_29]|nr:MAG: hypothetical protein A2240_01945 [Candidatus Jacksonbacteria bacterium RIFOXYA2_FULL_43_12]OGY75458.1 MAG: hypothetical protein A2295_05415 [Candidatus Jacksonbacteria bacterium RIFOXYB2_FULL_44_15]OGY78228.1 MAG: hypothetical protein A2445_04275 [Candidatus Jacksonbacteria bacterium RIFOXYC2_FULL_44_29]OGY80715.1 MAG: hypothetical protein A2550_00585 [Candidatus Jacksonbacteria bacterium RIFOXYD2_FULL_43_21]HCE49268.1 hypothetical protein [Candidatus Jacksonbacteria bacterium]